MSVNTVIVTGASAGPRDGPRATPSRSIVARSIRGKSGGASAGWSAATDGSAGLVGVAIGPAGRAATAGAAACATVGAAGAAGAGAAIEVGAGRCTTYAVVPAAVSAAAMTASLIMDPPCE